MSVCLSNPKLNTTTLFDDKFIKLARAVYYTNDVRAKIKKEINLKYSSGFVEEKSYQSY